MSVLTLIQSEHCSHWSLGIRGGAAWTDTAERIPLAAMRHVAKAARALDRIGWIVAGIGLRDYGTEMQEDWTLEIESRHGDQGVGRPSQKVALEFKLNFNLNFTA